MIAPSQLSKKLTGCFLLSATFMGIMLGSQDETSNFRAEHQLFEAAITGYSGHAASILASSPEVSHARCKLGKTPLHYAAEYGHLSIVRLLIEHGAEANAGDNSNFSAPLHYAAKHGRLNVVQFFVENGFDVNVRDSYKYTPLHKASRSGHAVVVEYLVNHGTEIDACNLVGETALHKASWSNYFSVVKVLILNGASINARTCDKITPLHNAAQWGSYETVRFLVEHGADVNALDTKNQTPLHHAARAAITNMEDYCNIIRLLVSKRTDLDVENEKQDTPFSLATQHCNAETIKFLIERYVFIRKVDAPHLAVFYAQESPQWLIDRRQKLSAALDQRLHPALRDLLMEFVLEKNDHLSIIEYEDEPE